MSLINLIWLIRFYINYLPAVYDAIQHLSSPEYLSLGIGPLAIDSKKITDMLLACVNVTD